MTFDLESPNHDRLGDSFIHPCIFFVWPYRHEYAAPVYSCPKHAVLDRTILDCKTGASEICLYVQWISRCDNILRQIGQLLLFR